ncbi:MAG: hypothetical protein KAJ23_03390 [Maribacter sp.]|nr:hypothetical protein [Maribacter sp.]
MFCIIGFWLFENLEIIAFLIPNVESNEPLDQFVVSIDRIEKMTGLDFFYKLMDSEQMQFEKTPSTAGWKF